MLLNEISKLSFRNFKIVRTAGAVKYLPDKLIDNQTENLILPVIYYSSEERDIKFRPSHTETR